MEGILEKPSRIPGRKTKVWSVLDNRNLSFFQENRRASCIGSVELEDIQSVNVVSDNQFEIKTDIISQTYTTDSQEQCNQWVQKLSKFSRGKTDSKGSTVKEIPVIQKPEETGEHTVEVKAARNIFESKWVKPNVPECKKAGKESTSLGRRVVSGIVPKNKDEPHKLRRSDPTRIHPFSSIEDARSHLNHVSSEDKSEKKINFDKFASLSKLDNHKGPTITSQKFEHVKSIHGPDVSALNGNQTNEPEMPTSDITVLNSKDNLTIKDIKSNSCSVESSKINIKNSHVVKSNISKDEDTDISSTAGFSANKAAEGSNTATLLNSETVYDSKNGTVSHSRDKNSGVPSENRPDSGYSTTAGENGRNSQENKIEDQVLPKKIQVTTYNMEGKSNASKEPEKTSEGSLPGEDLEDKGKQITANTIENNSSKDSERAAVDEIDGEKKIEAKVENLQEEAANETKYPVIDSEKERMNNQHNENGEEHGSAIVVMRKSRSRVSVSRDDKVSEITKPEDVRKDEILTFPDRRKNKMSTSKPAIEEAIENEPTSSQIINEKPKFTLRTDSEEGFESQISQDYVDGTNKNVPPQDEIVENYLDIDAIMNKAVFSNIPSLPNNTPNRSELLSFHELKETLEKINCSDEYSDLDSDEDPILTLSKLVET